MATARINVSLKKEVANTARCKKALLLVKDQLTGYLISITHFITRFIMFLL